jgi:hypothetical protein
MWLVTRKGYGLAVGFIGLLKLVATVIIALLLIHALIAISNYITTDN